MLIISISENIAIPLPIHRSMIPNEVLGIILLGFLPVNLVYPVEGIEDEQVVLE